MDVIRTELHDWEGLARLNIFGLTIGLVNRDALPEDPMITFLRNIISSIPCAAHMSMDPWYDRVIEEFAECYPSDRFITTHVGVYSHLTIGILADHPCGVYFPEIKFDDLMVEYEGDPIIDSLLVYDQPWLYLGVDSQNEAQLRDMFLHPPSDFGKYGDKWLQAATSVVPVVLAGGHDESYYHAYARSPECFDLLREPLAATERQIRESDWFKANEKNLHWSDETWEWCLTLPGAKQENHLLPGMEVTPPDERE